MRIYCLVFSFLSVFICAPHPSVVFPPPNISTLIKHEPPESVQTSLLDSLASPSGHSAAKPCVHDRAAACLRFTLRLLSLDGDEGRQQWPEWERQARC